MAGKVCGSRQSPLALMGSNVGGQNAVQQLGRNILFHAADVVFGLCRQRWRFSTVLALARFTTRLEPVFHRLLGTGSFPFLLDRDVGAKRLAQLLHRLTTHGIQFDPIITVNGAEVLGDGGAIIVSGHFALNVLFTRWLFDHGRQVSAVMGSIPDRLRIIGTRVPIEVIHPDTTSLIHIRNRVAAGGIVAVAIDSTTTGAGAATLDTPAGRIWINDTILQAAERANLPVVFYATHATPDGLLVANVARPSSTQAHIVLYEFCRFLAAAVA